MVSEPTLEILISQFARGGNTKPDGIFPQWPDPFWHDEDTMSGGVCNTPVPHRDVMNLSGEFVSRKVETILL